MIVDFKKGKTYKQPKWEEKVRKQGLPVFIVFIVASFLFLDKPFALLCRQMDSGIVLPLRLLMHLFSPTLALLVFPSLLFFVRFLQRQEGKSRKFLLLTLTVAISVLLSSFVQVVIGRSDPEWFFLHGSQTLRLFSLDPAFHSFPSSTSTSIGALSVCLARFYPKKDKKILGLGAFLGVVPAITTLCFLSDALVGLAVGLVVSYFVHLIVKREISF